MGPYLFERLKPDTLILTANKRLTRNIVHEYDQYRTDQNQKTWKTIEALPFDTWLKKCWEIAQLQNIAPPKILLNSHQEKYLWQEIIGKWLDDNPSAALLNVYQTAKAAQKTWNLLHQWKIPLTHPDLTATEESQTFCQWAKAFQSLCHQNSWLTQTELAREIRNLFERNLITPPANLMLAGFLELSPAKLDATFGVRHQKLHQTEPSASSIMTIALDNTETEIYTMARWAKHLLEQNEENKQHFHAQITIGCIVPQLSEIHDQVERIFRELVFDTKNYINISMGKRLAEYPMARAAFDLLSFAMDDEISVQQFSTILCSPFLENYENQINQRALLDAQLREIGKIKFTLAELTKIIFQIDPNSEFLEKLNQLSNLQSHFKKTSYLPSAWIEIFQDILTIFGWPGLKNLSHEEYSIFDHFQKLLLAYSKLDLFSQKMSSQKAFNELTCIASSAEFIFQPNSINHKNAPIQIIGLFEAIGLNFDYLWVMGMDHKNWPTQPSPNNFLPLFLQKKYNLPHVDAKREYNYCKTIMDILLSSAKTIIFSYPQNYNDEKLQPSPFIKKFTHIALPQLHLPEFKKREEQLFLNRKPLEKTMDERAPTLNETQETVRGGTALLKDQAACPFRAFAIHRLNAKSLEAPQEGFSPKERGLILHDALEILFKNIHSLEKLNSLLPADLEKLIHSAIHAAFKNKSIQFYDSFLRIEQKRIYQLLSRFLSLEKKRPAFEILALEKKYHVQIGQLNLKVRIDRLDKVNEHCVLIDYKTGLTSVKDWFGERPNEPQLPLYATFMKTAAIAFAQIHIKSVKFNSVSFVENLLPQNKIISHIKNVENNSSWDEQLQSWRKHLKKLADEFFEGWAKVAPKNPPKTCRHCALKSLCRIYEFDLL
ncbi:MAG: PD-(D/E)XK nuclease family protein [Gammaproteobacteria bacterium]|nr:PD-(D/E)XK nuclease family protein [Gammaproteobacteria bacterium]